MENSIPLRERIKSFCIVHKRPLIIAGVVSLCLVITITILAFQRHRDQIAPSGEPISGPSDPLAPSSSPTATPKLTANFLNGALVPDEKSRLRPLAVMIENHPEARPQAGLGSASLVYEAIAEGGITRFMAVFSGGDDPYRVGPVRSARTYFVDFATELNAFYAHVGGNINALNQIKATKGFFDMDQFSIGSPVFQRDTSRNVSTEHTMFSSTDKLWNYATTTKKWSPVQDFTPWLFTDDPDLSVRPTSHSVTINFSEPQYAVKWDYNQATNRYKRTMGGVAHNDDNTNEQLSASAIILQSVAKQLLVVPGEKDVWKYTLTGTGKAVIIQNGTATQATWQKSGTERTIYSDTTGKQIEFTRGPLWVEIVHSDTPTSY